MHFFFFFFLIDFTTIFILGRRATIAYADGHGPDS